MQYRILVDIDAANLGERVQQAIESGWDLQGGVSVASMPHGVIFVQAITNEQDAPMPAAIDNRSLSDILKHALDGIRS